MIAEQILNDIQNLANKELALHHSRFFKTGKGDYAEGDLFYGVKVPEIRKITKKYYKSIGLDDVEKLIKHSYHEVRLAAVIILVLKFSKALPDEQKEIYTLYLNNVETINNWDLVDVSSPNIVGAYLFDKNKDKIKELAASKHLWSERIAVLATFYFIKQGEYKYTLDLSEYFLEHSHDLMHKATGWMLREVGKREINLLYGFLDEFYKVMPRTMLRYAIEKLPENKRQMYLKK